MRNLSLDDGGMPVDAEDDALLPPGPRHFDLREVPEIDLVSNATAIPEAASQQDAPFFDSVPLRYTTPVHRSPGLEFRPDKPAKGNLERETKKPRDGQLPGFGGRQQHLSPLYAQPGHDVSRQFLQACP